jgi:hypothetical protein
MNRQRWAVPGHKPIVQAADSIGRSLPLKAGPGSREGAGKDSGQDAQEHDGRIRSRCNFPGMDLPTTESEKTLMMPSVQRIAKNRKES